MIKFTILKRSKKSRARLGTLKTPHGVIETPAIVPVATQAAVKSLNLHDDLEKTKRHILNCNTFHLHLKPGEKIVKLAGLKKGWPKIVQPRKALNSTSNISARLKTPGSNSTSVRQRCNCMI